MHTSEGLKKAVAARLKEARKALDLTQKELCARVGMPFSSLRNYESGDQIPGGEALSMLMKVGIAPAWLLTGTGEMLCKTAEATGLAIASAIRQSGLSNDEVLARLGIGIDELLSYLEGRAIPENALLERVSEVTGYPLSKLQAAREMGDAIAQIDVMHARVMSRVKDEAEKIGMTADEALLLGRFSRADEKGKALLMKISAALDAPSLKAWLDAGIALGDAASIFETKR